MKIAFVCNDTRGGVQPYVAVAAGFKRAGYEVRALCPAHSAALFLKQGIAVVEQFGTAEEFVEASRRAAEGGLLESIRLHLFEAAPRMKVWQEQALRGCEGVDFIAGGLGGLATAASAAKKLNVPFVQMHLQPVFAPSSKYAGVLAPKALNRLGRIGNDMGHAFSDMLVKAMVASWLPNSDELPVFYGFSPRVVPIECSQQTQRFLKGYWHQPFHEEWNPPQELEAFLHTEEEVVCIGFGSMVSKNPQKLFATMIATVKKIGKKTLILSGWNQQLNGLRDDSTFVIDEVPHSWLFDKVGVLVHHGGAGTTGAAFTAGKPQVIIPFGMDQTFWAGRVEQLGTGSQAILRNALTADSFARAVKTALTPEVRESAAALGTQLQKESGVNDTIALFEKLIVKVIHKC